ncbi:MAG TPA: PIG-L deacetylase family protein [Anaerolineales bacterium]|nr:PIG-L deacetylase family protein [Anaerolineales bacterium]
MTIETILPTPNIFEARRILCIQPHYDDNDIAAAGILTQLAKRGAELFYLTATDDLMGVVDVSLSDEAAAEALKRDQFAAGKIVGVKEQYWCGYPDAGEYNYFDLRRDFLKYIRMLKPDFVFAPDAWLTYEGHHDHIQTGLAAAEAVMFADLTKIASSDPDVDAAYEQHDIKGIVLYFTREPNYIADISSTWEEKVGALRCYEAQFSPSEMEQLIAGRDMKSQQVAQGQSFARGEALKVLHTSALHVGI